MHISGNHGWPENLWENQRRKEKKEKEQGSGLNLYTTYLNGSKKRKMIEIEKFPITREGDFVDDYAMRVRLNDYKIKEEIKRGYHDKPERILKRGERVKEDILGLVDYIELDFSPSLFVPSLYTRNGQKRERREATWTDDDDFSYSCGQETIVTETRIVNAENYYCPITYEILKKTFPERFGKKSYKETHKGFAAEDGWVHNNYMRFLDDKEEGWIIWLVEPDFKDWIELGMYKSQKIGTQKLQDIYRIDLHKEKYWRKW